MPARIAAAIAPAEPDIVALQELDIGRKRTGGVDQAEAIAFALGMRPHFHPAMRVMEELYGDAILTSAPSRLIKGGPLPGPRHVEPRGAVWAEMDLRGTALQILNTHLGVRRAGRLKQVEALLGPAWIGAALDRGPVLLAGDFNSVPSSPVYRRLGQRLREAGSFPGVGRPPPTFPSFWPRLRLDHVFAGPGIRITAVAALTTPLARMASDHLPLVVDFERDAD